MIKTIKTFLILFVFFNYNQVGFSKPLPPGSGSGDVPANILFLLDSSISMNRQIGAGIPHISSITIDGDGNKILTSVDRRTGGIYKFNSDGEQIAINYLNQDGVSLATRRWVMGPGTDNVCDFRIGTGTGTTTDFNIGRDFQFHEVEYQAGVTVGGTTISNEDLLFVGIYNDNRQPFIFALNSDMQCRLAITGGMGDAIRGFDIAMRNGVPAIYWFGATSRERRGAYLSTCNLGAGTCDDMVGRGRNRTDTYGRLFSATRIRIADGANIMYLASNSDMFGYTLPDQVNGLPVNTQTPFRHCNPMSRIMVIGLSNTDDDIFYAGDWNEARIYKYEWADNRNCTELAAAGTNSALKNSGNAGTIAADSIRIDRGLGGLRVIGDRILFPSRSYVTELSEASFNTANRDNMWQNSIGGGRVTRWTGAKSALRAVFSDGTLTSGANFGFGHWNAGQGERGRRVRPLGGAWCHGNNTRCNYYGGWTGNAPDVGRSVECTRNSCLNVGIGPNGAANAMAVLDTLGVEWGTDSEAFSQIALEYFAGPVSSPIDPNSDCQLNYVIVIGDGEQSGTGVNGQRGRTAERLTRLRQEFGVKTLMVAYGGGISNRGMNSFNALARIGSCDNAGDQECMDTIVADTPQDLRTQLQSIIRQIIAERLAFTAPSITATIQEGGSLYQAQFAYEQFGEWQGTILRKQLNPDGTVEHEENHPGNWSSAERVRLQAARDERNIWTAMPAVSYIGDWNNFRDSDETRNEISALFNQLDFNLVDYYDGTAGQRCPNLGDAGTADELRGLISFMRGADYFDYNGDCDITEIRDHVQGDIYHSQLIEIGSPDGSTQFTDNNQEAYYRTINNYQNFRAMYSQRRNVLYAGYNSGMLHAINAETGDEEWAFIPPFVAGRLPIIINQQLDDVGNNNTGGSNAIFGVDGSPIVHDVFMRGLRPNGQLEDDPSWHTILMVPYGRGGAGFSVLDVTNPIISPGVGPLHMFSVYNDYINQVVYIADENGNITERQYTANTVNIEDSREALRANTNLDNALTQDGWPDNDSTIFQDPIAVCQSNDDVTGGFAANGTNTCYRGTTYTFDSIQFDVPDNSVVPPEMINVSAAVSGGEFEPVTFTEARMVNGSLVITFEEPLTYNPGGSVNETRQTDNFFIQSTCSAATGIPPEFDYSKMGETWSTPRIVRLPSDNPNQIDDRNFDKYVAIMGGGLAANNLCTGSAVYLVELNNMEDPGRIYGAAQNNGPITIIDTSPNGIAIGNDIIDTPTGSDIDNSVPTTPIVITPDTAFGIPWRGAMVYVNDREGKITKINLTDSTKNGAQIFDQTTLFKLNATGLNGRVSFFGMDAGVGVSTRDFWLFGGTGNFNQLGARGQFMDNILYGIRDRDYPFFRHLNGVQIPRETDPIFVETAHLGADAARTIDDAAVCSDVTGDIAGDLCPRTEDAWVIHLDTVDGLPTTDLNTLNSFRKTSAPPTLFQGQVYFPVYEPPAGANRCNIGNAYICASDDECGTNNSHELIKGGRGNGSACVFVREGVLSELVIFDNKLFANVAGPSETEQTLYSILAIAGEVLSNRGGWRDVGF